MRPSLQRLFLGPNMKKAQTNEVYDGLWFHVVCYTAVFSVVTQRSVA